MKNNTWFRSLICLALCFSMVILFLPQTAYGNDDEDGLILSGSDGSSSSSSEMWGHGGTSVESLTTASMEDLIAICKKYSDPDDLTGVRNQIIWMNSLYSAAVQNFVSHLGLGDALLISILNHSDINTTLMKSSYSIGDINREVASQIISGAEGYVDINTIAGATGLKAKDVEDILKGIAAGNITEKTIAAGKSASQNTNRGPYLKAQAQKQEKVFDYLAAEVERMCADPEALNRLYDDLGAGYVKNLLSDYTLDSYQVMLDKKYLAKILDNVLESDNPYSVCDYDISGTEAYKVTKKTRSAISKLYSYTIGQEEANLSDELKAFLNEHLKNGILSVEEAREYLILSGEYKAGELGIGEAAKQLVKGYKHLQTLDTVLDSSGKVFDVIEKAKKAEEFIDYWATDYSQHELILDSLVETLSDSGTDMELLVAAKELQAEYSDKLSGTVQKISSELVDKGIGTVKSTFPPLGIAEACISLGGTLTGADDKVKALETGLAMQYICKQALTDYENAVIAVNKGDTSEEAASRVLTTFEIARQSLISYYEAMVELADLETEKDLYSYELAKLNASQFGQAFVTSPFKGNGGSAKGR